MISYQTEHKQVLLLLLKRDYVYSWVKYLNHYCFFFSELAGWIECISPEKQWCITRLRQFDTFGLYILVYISLMYIPVTITPRL